MAGRAHSEVLKSTASSTMHIKGKWKMLKYGNQSTETKYRKQSMEVRRKVAYPVSGVVLLLVEPSAKNYDNILICSTVKRI